MDPTRALRRVTVAAVLLAVCLLGACAGDDERAEPGSTDPSTTVDPTANTGTSAPATTQAPDPALRTITPSTTEPDPTPDTTDGEGSTDTTGPAPTGPPPPVYELDWTKLTIEPFFAFDDETDPDDPFWHLHTDPADNLFFSLEMYTSGFGQAWTGEQGDFEMACNDASSGICLQLDPNPGEDEPGNLNADFLAVGTIRIDRLDEGGYDLTISDVAFSDGSTLPGPTRLRGEAPDR